MLLVKKLTRLTISSNDNKWMQSTDSIETYAYGTRQDLVSEKEEIKCSNIMKRYQKRLTLMI